MFSEGEILFKNMERLYENIYNLCMAFQTASTTNIEDIYVDLKNADGSISRVKVNSFQKILNELNRIDNNFTSITNDSGLSYILNADGSISMQEKVSFFNAEYIDKFNLDPDNLVIDRTSIVDDLITPTVKLPIELNDTLFQNSEIFCRMFDVSFGWEDIPDDCSILNMEYLYGIGKINYKEVNRTLSLQKQQVQYFGKFNTESVIVKEQFIEVILNNILYTGLNIVGNNIELKIGDTLVSKSGTAKYLIIDVNRFENKLQLRRISGIESLQVGIDTLYFNELLPLDGNKIVNVPIGPSKKYIVFLSTENFKNISYPSVGIKIDTSTYKIVYNNNTFTLDEFFGQYVTNFAEYLQALLYENSIPITLGIIPNKPNIIAANFKVIQINKHLNDSKTADELSSLQKQKQKIQNDIEYNQSLIRTLQEDIESQKYNSQIEKEYQIQKLTTLRNQVNIFQQNLLTITRDIDNNAIQNNLKNAKPKYRVIGFWDVQPPIYSAQTREQHIIKYDVQYRYLSKNSDTVSNTSYQMIDDNGKKISVSFSAWNNLETVALSKVKKINGEYSWEENPLDSSDLIKINQCCISINENESIELRVRAISEAGYPISPLKSPWSETLRVDFPVDLRDNNLSSIISQNNIDLNLAEFNNILDNYGLLKHISGTLQENEKLFLHNAKDITSGQFTAEQKNIPLDIFLNTLISEINVLKKTDVFTNVNISIVDFSENEYQVINNSSLNIFGGNYADNFNILDTLKWGTIIRLKGYIKIRNNNGLPIELRTLVPGVVFDQTTAADYYNVPVVTENQIVQNSKQIIYFRNKDLSGQASDMFLLVKPKLPDVKTYPLSSDIIPGLLDIDKNVAYLDTDGHVKICKLKPKYTPDFNAFTVENPVYDYDNMDLMISEFNRITTYTTNLKADLFQNEATQSDIYWGFNNNDMYAIGRATCGAYFYPIIANPSNIQVIGNTTTATLIIPKESEILLPIVYEYRMIDRLGNINGEIDFDTNSILEYKKKMGIDILINNEMFKFDITVNTRLKSKVITFDQVAIQSIKNNFNNEPKEILY
jgi:hypothetical protein